MAAQEPYDRAGWREYMYVEGSITRRGWCSNSTHSGGSRWNGGWLSGRGLFRVRLLVTRHVCLPEAAAGPCRLANLSALHSVVRATHAQLFVISRLSL